MPFAARPARSWVAPSHISLIGARPCQHVCVDVTTLAVSLGGMVTTLAAGLGAAKITSSSQTRDLIRSIQAEDVRAKNAEKRKVYSIYNAVADQVFDYYISNAAEITKEHSDKGAVSTLNDLSAKVRHAANDADLVAPEGVQSLIN